MAKVSNIGAKDIKNIILSYECDYELIEKELKTNFENTTSGIFSAMTILLRKIENQKNEDAFLNIIYILDEYIKECKSKIVLEKLAEKISKFLKNLDSLLQKKRRKSLNSI